MEKKALNNKIVLCRSVVRKARVLVTRKIIKKMKILRSCKNEAVKEKKLKKAENLYSRIQVMKKLKEDDVSIFALLTDNYDQFLKNASKNMEKAALASLAKHVLIRKAVSEIKDCIPNWRFELLHFLAKKKKSRKLSKLLNEKVKENKINNSDKKKRIDRVESNEILKVKNAENLKQTSNISKNKSFNGKNITSIKSKLSNDKVKKKEFALEKHNKKETNSDKKVTVAKIDDPFFIEKKVIVPKLYTNNLETKTTSNKLDHIRNLNLNFEKSSKYLNKSFKTNNCEKSNAFNSKNDNVNTLHPSWAAKKVTLIKPFEGKKIKFSDDD